jgi:hypothetical protein
MSRNHRPECTGENPANYCTPLVAKRAIALYGMFPIPLFHWNIHLIYTFFTRVIPISLQGSPGNQLVERFVNALTDIHCTVHREKV